MVPATRGQLMERTHDFDWDELLGYIEEERVIPVVGRDLLEMEVDGRPVPLHQLLGANLADELGLGRAEPSPDTELGAVAFRHLQGGGDRRKIYSKLKRLVERLEIPVPPALRQLAEISHFNLFVSTTFDNLLARALAEVHGDPSRVECLAFSPYKQVEDLPREKAQLTSPVVFQLFGRLASSTDYAVIDEDTLEFLHALQSETKRPEILFDEFRQNHLLFLGCGFPDWLARFFIRTVANQRFLNPREACQIVADEEARRDQSLCFFLQHYETEVFLPSGASEFVAELHRRWVTAWPSAAPSRPAASPAKSGDAIFLSYTREDETLVRPLVEAFERAGLDVWYDSDRLDAGDAWDRQIRSNIRRAPLFVPLLSKNAEGQSEGYFRREWNWAIERSEGIDPNRPFILPVVLDDLLEGAPGIPDYFWTKQVTRFGRGVPSEEFVNRTRDLIREIRATEAGF